MQGAVVYCQDKEIGVVTSGTMSPTLGVAIANALIKEEYKDCTEFTVDVRGTMLKAVKTTLPYYKREK